MKILLFTPRQICKWKIKMIKYPGYEHNEYSPYIGIIKDDDKLLNKYKIQGTNLKKDGYIFCSGPITVKRPSDQKYGKPFTKNGSVMEIILNLQNYTIKYKIDGKDLGIAFKDILKTKYRLFCSIQCQTTIQIVG